MNKNQNGIIHFVLILGVAVVALALIGFNLYKSGKILTTPSQTLSPTPVDTADEPANWKKYTDNNLEFKYPSNWHTDSELPSHFVRFSSSPYQDFFYGKLPGGNVELILQRVYRNKSIPLNKYAIVDETPNTTKQETSRRNSTIGGKKAIELDYKDESQNEIGKVIYISTDNFATQADVGGAVLKFPDGAEVIILMRYYYYSNDARKEYYNQTIDQILSTFKFTSIITPTPSSTRRCKNSDFQIQSFSDAATGTILQGMVLTNISSSSCKLEGYLKVTLKDSEGKVLKINSNDIPNDNLNKSVIVQPQERAQTNVYLNNYCLGGDNFYYYYLPTESSSILKVPAEQKTSGRCDNPENSPYVSVGAFEFRKDPY